jgi:23S rRNA (guanosine2251-2'-O)-methyltransferase
MAAEQEPAPILDDIRELCLARRVTLREIGRGKFESLAATQSAQGVLARAQPLDEADLDDLADRRRRARRAPFLVALDGVTDPGNLGALLRSAEGAGVSGVVLPRHRSVHVTPAVTKAAAGAVEYVPIALVGGLPTALAQLGRLGVWTIGLDGGADRSLFELTYLDEPVCLVLGAEGRGLSRLARERCHELVSIPLGGQLNSLNVAAAGAVACFEVARQRNAAAGRPAPDDVLAEGDAEDLDASDVEHELDG